MESKYTVEQLEVLSDDDLSDVAARNVMGWSIVGSSNLAPPWKRYFGLQSDNGGDAISWQFASDEIAAFVAVDEICKWEAMFRLEYSRPEWTAEFQTDQDNPGHFRQFAVHTSQNRTRAIAIACILAAQKLAHAD